MQTGASRDYGRPGASQVAKRRQFLVWRYASFAGVRSPPLPDADAPKSDGLAGKGPRIGGWRFSRRSAVSASVWYGPPDPRGLRSDPMWRRTAGGLPGTSLGQTRPLLPGVQSPPLRGDVRPTERASRGGSRSRRMEDFLGGMRSARPSGKAGCEPGFRMTSDGWARGRGPNGDMSG